MIKTVKLEELASVKGGKRLPKGVNLITTPNSHPYIRVRDLNNRHTLELDADFEYVDDETQKSIARYIVDRGDIVLSIVGTIGLVAIVGDSLHHANLTENCVKLTQLNGVNRDYLYYFLKSELGQAEIAKGTVGAVQAKLPIKNIQAIEVVLPSLEQQEKIASILAAIDYKIEANEKINDNLQQQALAIFDSMFSNVYTSSERTIGDYIVPKRGKPLLSKDAIAGDVPVVAGGLEPSTYHNVANTFAPVITISASGANAGFVNLWDIPVWSSDSSFIDFSVTEGVYFWFALLKKYQKKIFDAQTGSAQAHIYPQHIAALPIGDISAQQILEYHRFVMPMFSTIGHNKKENLRLGSLRDALLPRLMSGDIDVSSIDI